MFMDKNGYQWKFCSLGGVTRVNIASGEDVAHLGELDQKLWTVLSCPVKGLEFDQKTLELLDTDGDGKIRVAEIVAAAEWLTSVLKDKDSILKGEDELPLSQINTDCEAGKKLYVATSKPEATAIQILEKFNLSQYFDIIAGATKDASRDTKDAVIRYLLEQSGETGKAVMVGDTAFDVEGANAHQMPCIGVSWGFGTVESMQEEGACAIAETPEELYRLLTEE